MTCGTCKWLEVPPDKAGHRRVIKDKAYRCACPIPDVVLPQCVTNGYGWKWPPGKNWVSHDSGQDCPTFEPRP